MDNEPIEGVDIEESKEEQLENDEISAEEEGFMRGYEDDADDTTLKDPNSDENKEEE